MGSIKGHFEWDDDALSPGQSSKGGLSQNLYDDDGGLAGHAHFVPESDEVEITEYTFLPIETRREDVDADLAEALATLALAAMVWGTAVAAPHVKHWFQETARPALRVALAKVRLHKPGVIEGRAQVVQGAVVATPVNAEVVEVLVEARPKMAIGEAQARMIAAVAAQAFAEEQLRLVNGADIVTDRPTSDVAQSLRELPEKELKELVVNLAKNPQLLTEDNLAQLASILPNMRSL